MNQVGLTKQSVLSMALPKSKLMMRLRGGD